MIKKNIFKKGNFDISFVFMLILFVTILFFGIKGFFFIDNSKVISEDSSYENVISKINSKISICEDPLKKGSVNEIILKKTGFNSICILSDDILYSNPSSLYSGIDEFKLIYEGGDNLVLIDGNFHDFSNSNSERKSYVLDQNSLNVKSSGKVPLDFKRTKCIYSEGSEISIRITC